MNANVTATPAAASVDHHYFATCAFGWSVAATRTAAIAKLARFVGASIIAAQRKASGGLYVWSCHVGVPETAHYAIENFMPQEVPVTRTRECRVTSVKGESIPTD